MAEPIFRPAHPEEADALGEMVIAGVRHWGHHLGFPEAVEGLRQHGLPTADYVASAPVHVLEDEAGTIGFYGLAVEDDFVDLRYMFLQPDRIGQGYGRRLWEHAVAEGARHGSRMRIRSDPRAVDFYRAMGAEYERDVEVSPGFRLGVFWYQLRE